MTPQFAIVSAAPLPVVGEPQAGDTEQFDPDNVFALIEQTVATIRKLREDNELGEQREFASRATFEQDRARWRDEMDRMRSVVEASIERAKLAEDEAERARGQATRALAMCRELQTQERSAAARALLAERRAETAERLLSKISRELASV